MNEDLRDEDQDELGNGAALLDDSLFEEDPELDLLEDEEVKAIILDPLAEVIEEDEEEEEIYDELDALAKEEDEEDDFLMDSYDDDY